MPPRFKPKSEAPTSIGFQFLHAEINTGKVFASIALRSVSEEKIARNRSRARLAHDTALRFFERLPLTRLEWENIHERLQDLKADLRRLGEVF